MWLQSVARLHLQMRLLKLQARFIGIGLLLLCVYFSLYIRCNFLLFVYILLNLNYTSVIQSLAVILIRFTAPSQHSSTGNVNSEIIFFCKDHT